MNPFSPVIVGSEENSNHVEISDRLGDLLLDRIGSEDTRPSWVFSNIWDVSGGRWFIGEQNSENVNVDISRRMPVASWNDVPQFRMEIHSAEMKRLFTGRVIRTGSEDEFTSTKEAFARDCFLWSIADDISKAECDVIPSCWAATPVKTAVANALGVRGLNICESVTEQILMLTDLRQGEMRQVKSPRFQVLNEEGFDKEVDEEGVVWQEGKDSCFKWLVSSDSPFSRASGMNTASAERLADRKFRGAVSLMNCIKCLLCFEGAKIQDHGQVSLWLENEGRWLTDLVLNDEILTSDGDYEVCVTNDPVRNGKVNAEGIEIDFIYVVSVKENLITGLRMSDKGLKGASDSRRVKLNGILEEVMTAKRDGRLHGWLSQHIYNYVTPSLIDVQVCYNRSPFRVLEMMQTESVVDHLNLEEKLCNGDIEVLSENEREADHLGMLTYAQSDDRKLLAGGFKGHKVSWKNETLKLFRRKLGVITVKREGANLRSGKLGVLAAMYRVVHDTNALEAGIKGLKWERVDGRREPETQIVLNSLLSGRLGISGFTWAIAFLRDSGIRLKANSACYLKQFHAADGEEGQYEVRQILNSAVLRKLEAVEFTMGGERRVGLDFCLPGTILCINQENNNAEMVLRQDCGAMIKGRIKKRIFLGGERRKNKAGLSRGVVQIY